MRTAIAFIPLFAALLSLAHGAEPPPGSSTLTMADAVQLAREANPAVRAARIDVDAAEAARRGAGAPVQNPEVSLGAGARITEGGPQADVAVRFEVPLDVGGAARQRRSREAAGLEAARARLAATELEAAVADNEQRRLPEFIRKLRPGVEHANDRLVPEVLFRVAELHHPRAMAEAAQIVRSEPARGS